MTLAELQGKKIAVVGAGINNQKLADYFSRHHINYEVLAGWKHNDELIGQLDNFDIIFRTPGLPYLHPAVVQAKNQGVIVYSQTKLFLDLCPAQVIGVTGTKGKGTTSTLIAKVLEAGEHKVWLAGNVGTDPFEFLDFVHPNDLVVLELSSFQLQDLERSPHVGVLLNITADHLDESGTYSRSAHGSLKEYFDSKLQLIMHQTPGDYAVISHELPTWVRETGAGTKIIFNPGDVADYEYRLLGRHNLENIAAAVAVGKIYHVPEPAMRDVVKNFTGLPHRLQKVKEKNGVNYIDDSISTNEDSTIAAVNAFSTPLILILGGSSKGLDYHKLGAAVKQATQLKGLVVVGEEAPKILRAVEGFAGRIFTGAKTMAEMVAQAESIAEPGDTILLSPAAASFDMFRDYKDRAEQFLNSI